MANINAATKMGRSKQTKKRSFRDTETETALIDNKLAKAIAAGETITLKKNCELNYDVC